MFGRLYPCNMSNLYKDNTSCAYVNMLLDNYARPSFPHFRRPTWNPFPKPSRTWANIHRPLFVNTSPSQTHLPFRPAVARLLTCTHRAARNYTAPLPARELPHPLLSPPHPYSGSDGCFYVLCAPVIQMR